MKNILLIYTGGTIGMLKDGKNSLRPFNFHSILNAFPELKDFDANIDYLSSKKYIDSSDMHPKNWNEIAKIIQDNYSQYDSFVVLHGTDTMAYTASALSFMLEGLNKAIILTGSQIPIGARRTDAKENLITAIEIAVADKISEVCIYFEDKLLRGNRTVKVNSDHFEAFESPHFPELARVGVNIKYNLNLLRNIEKKSYLSVFKNTNPNIGLLKLFPGISENLVKAIVENSQAVVMESFGSGNSNSNKKFISVLKQAINNGKIIVNCSQCFRGSVQQGKYENSSALNKIGVISARDMTTEASITKLIFLLSQGLTNIEIISQFQKNLRGEMTN